MQQIRVRYENGVFIPLEDMTSAIYEGMKAVIEVVKEKRKADRKTCQALAKSYSEEKFPDVEVSPEVLDLVGILHGVQCNDYKAEYRKHLREKYGD